MDFGACLYGLVNGLTLAGGILLILEYWRPFGLKNAVVRAQELPVDFDCGDEDEEIEREKMSKRSRNEQEFKDIDPQVVKYSIKNICLNRAAFLYVTAGVLLGLFVESGCSKLCNLIWTAGWTVMLIVIGEVVAQVKSNEGKFYTGGGNDEE